MKTLFTIALIIASASVSIAKESVFTQTRLRFIENTFKHNLENIDAHVGAVCVVEDGNILLAKNLDVNNKAGKLENFPLGYTSQPLVSLMMAIMKKNLKFDTDWNVSKFCSYLISPYDKATFDDLLSMNAGIYPYYDSLVPKDCSASELFDILAQFPKALEDSKDFSRSEISSAIAGYAMAYMFDKSEKDFKKSFAQCSQTNLFEPLEFSEPKFVNFYSPMFSAKPFALNIQDCAKWLAFETNPNSKIAFKTDVDMRRLSTNENSKFSQGWLKSVECDVEFFVSADFFQNCANVVAIFPKQNIAIAFFALSKDAPKATKSCVDSLSTFINTILTPSLNY